MVLPASTKQEWKPSLVFTMTSEQILLYRNDKKINLYYFVFSQIQTCNSFILEDYIILNIP